MGSSLLINSLNVNLRSKKHKSRKLLEKQNTKIIFALKM